MAERALLYGHSQTGGMGVALHKALQAKGWQVKRIVHNGWGDAKLLNGLSAVPDLDSYTRVYLYAGGNSDAPTVPDLTALVQATGVTRTVIILPPVNLGRDPAKVAAQQARNAANAEGLGKLVKVVQSSAQDSEFYTNTDHVHLRADSPTALKIATDLTADLSAPVTPSEVGTGGMLLLGLLAAGWWIWRRKV